MAHLAGHCTCGLGRNGTDRVKFARLIRGGMMWWITAVRMLDSLGERQFDVHTTLASSRAAPLSHLTFRQNIRSSCSDVIPGICLGDRE